MLFLVSLLGNLSNHTPESQDPEWWYPGNKGEIEINQLLHRLQFGLSLCGWLKKKSQDLKKSFKKCIYKMLKVGSIAETRSAKYRWFKSEGWVDYVLRFLVPPHTYQKNFLWRMVISFWASDYF